MTVTTRMKIAALPLFITASAFSFDNASWQSASFSAKNKLDKPVLNAEICISQSQVSFPLTSAFVISNGDILPHQITDCNGDFEANDLQLLSSFAGGESKHFSLYSNATTDSHQISEVRAATELAVRVGGVMSDKGRLEGGTYLPVSEYVLPKEHVVGDHLFKYEGVGIESNKMAYRYYFDHRGSLDVFGKLTSKLVLPIIGQDGTNYHEMNDWGMDVLKVGKSFGLGTPGAYSGKQYTKMTDFTDLQAKLTSGVNSASFKLQFSNWRVGSEVVDANVRYSINHDDAKVKVVAKTSEPLKSWATGIVNHGLEPLLYLPRNAKWGYLATFGKQSLADDNMGMAILFKQQDFIEHSNDKINHVVRLGAKTDQIQYYFLADWQAGIDGSADQNSFKKKLAFELAKLNSPIQISFKN